ncbi:sugar phosphate isomerase/epimerase family protein [Hafnia psychrotolerans]|uniref:Sugar phosphate isomerase/epimerase n=1 Tax=Hafnia psychrotolerans TaxID=1477018 RepID=A0ABQ1H2Y1_9GAMM|nr:sugar phosphate isomerase/epimerase [Hafnia psychrotolerans]GGA57009.1 hypothetical protein GCM10011328_35590 [Hafnia psychrotolerans]
MKKEIVVVMSAYGNDNVKALGGQVALLPVIADAGADGVEIRRELFTPADLSNLPDLAEKIRQKNLFTVYSVPESLFVEGGKVNPSLATFLEEAATLGARSLKLALGYFKAGKDLTPLKVILGSHPVKLVVENDQTSDCGILSQLNAFMFAAQSLHLPLTMAFDMANWLWVGQDPMAAADRVAQHVGYIHVKAAQKCGEKWHAVALDDADGSWKPLLEKLPQDVPRGIEFPLEGEDLTAVTRHYVEMLREDTAQA